MRSRRLGAAGALALLLAGLLYPSGTQAADAAPARPAGERVALAKGCGACHALPGEPRGKKPGPSFLSPAPPQPASEVLRRLWNHAPAMLDRIDKSGIPYPVFQEGEMADLLGFLGAFADVFR